MVLQYQPVGTEVSVYGYCSVSKQVRKPLHNRRRGGYCHLCAKDIHSILSPLLITLDGRLVNSNVSAGTVKSLSKGLYIINGRKVLIK